MSSLCDSHYYYYDKRCLSRLPCLRLCALNRSFIQNPIQNYTSSPSRVIILRHALEIYNSVWQLALQDQYEYPPIDSNYSMRISSRDVSARRVVRIVVRVWDTCIYTSVIKYERESRALNFIFIFLRDVVTWSYVLKELFLQEPMCACSVRRKNVATYVPCHGLHAGMMEENNIEISVLFTTT